MVVVVVMVMMLHVLRVRLGAPVLRGRGRAALTTTFHKLCHRNGCQNDFHVKSSILIKLVAPRLHLLPETLAQEFALHGFLQRKDGEKEIGVLLAETRKCVLVARPTRELTDSLRGMGLATSIRPVIAAVEDVTDELRGTVLQQDVLAFGVEIKSEVDEGEL